MQKSLGSRAPVPAISGCAANGGQNGTQEQGSRAGEELTAVAAAHAVNDYLFATVGLTDHNADRRWTRYNPSAVEALARAVPESCDRTHRLAAERAAGSGGAGLCTAGAGLWTTRRIEAGAGQHARHADRAPTLDPDQAAVAAAPAVLATTCWRGGVEQTLRRIAADRGIDFTPIPDAVADALPELVDRVEQLTAGMDEQQRQWLAAALAALADHTQYASLAGQHPAAARRQ